MIPDPDPRWLVAFWLVIGVSLVVTVLAAIVFVLDLRGGAFSDADVDAPMALRPAPSRVDAGDRSDDPTAVSRVRAVSRPQSRLDPVDPAR